MEADAHAGDEQERGHQTQDHGEPAGGEAAEEAVVEGFERVVELAERGRLGLVYPHDPSGGGIHGDADAGAPVRAVRQGFQDAEGVAGLRREEDELGGAGGGDVGGPDHVVQLGNPKAGGHLRGFRLGVVPQQELADRFAESEGGAGGGDQKQRHERERAEGVVEVHRAALPRDAALDLEAGFQLAGRLRPPEIETAQ